MFQQRDGEVHTFLIVSVNSCGTLYFTRMGSCLDIDLLFVLSSSLVSHSLITHLTLLSPFPPLLPTHGYYSLHTHGCWLTPALAGLDCRQLVSRFVAVRRLPSQRVVRGDGRPLCGQGPGPPDQDHPGRVHPQVRRRAPARPNVRGFCHQGPPLLQVHAPGGQVRRGCGQAQQKG